jgi:hypothetical protein
MTRWGWHRGALRAISGPAVFSHQGTQPLLFGQWQIPLPFLLDWSDGIGGQGGVMDQPPEQTMTYEIGFKRPPETTQFRKAVPGNPYGRKSERQFVVGFVGW